MKKEEKTQLTHFRMSKKGKKNLSGGMAGLSLEDGGSDGSDEEMEQVEVRSRLWGCMDLNFTTITNFFTTKMLKIYFSLR